MRQVTHYFPSKEDLQYVIDQIEKYDKGVIEIKEKSGFYAVFRTDLEELKS